MHSSRDSSCTDHVAELVRDTEVHTGLGRGRGREKERGEERDSGLTGNVGGG